MATTGTPTPEQPTKAPLSAEEKALNLEIARFKLEQEKFAFEKLKYEDVVLAKGHFPIFPPDHPQNVMWSFAEGVLGAKYIAAEARDSVNSIFYLLNTAHDLELAWTFALRVIGMTTRGQVVIPGNLMLAILHKKKFKVRLLETNEKVAAYEIERPDGSMKWSCPITWDQAHKAGWPYGKDDGMKEPWKDPANMLRWRSLAYTARVVAADALGGLVYIAEEMDDAGGQVINIQADVEADAKAESDPKLELKKLEGTPTEQVIDIPLKTPKPEPVAADLSPQELKNEAFLKEQTAKAEPAKRTRRSAATPEPEPPKPSLTPEKLTEMAEANAAEHGITDDDLPHENASEPIVEIPPTPPVIDEKAALVARYDAIVKTYGGTRATINRFAVTYLGDSKMLSQIDKLRPVIDVLEDALFNAPPAAIAIFVADPEQFARNVKVSQNPSAPIAEEAPDDIPPSDNPLDDMLPESWSKETATAAWNAMKARGLTVDKFNAALKTFGVNLMSSNEAHCLFRLYFHSPDAMILAKRCLERKHSLCACVAYVDDELGAPLTEKTASDAALKAITNALTEVISMEVVK